MNPGAYVQMAETESRHWWFTGRRAILSDIIRSLDLPPRAKILELGSGTGGNLEMLARYGHVSALEMDATARSISMEKTAGRFDVRGGSCPSDIPFSGQQFDLVCLFDVLEHIEEDLATLTAVKALLAPRGRVLLTVPAYRWLWSAHDEFLHHKRRYSAAELRGKILAAGLRPARISHFNTLLFPLAAIARIKDRLTGSRVATGTGIPPAPLNGLLAAMLGAERHILGKVDLPVGVSLLAVLERAGSN